jgi:hypothetical protein
MSPSFAAHVNAARHAGSAGVAFSGVPSFFACAATAVTILVHTTSAVLGAEPGADAAHAAKADARAAPVSPSRQLARMAFSSTTASLASPPAAAERNARSYELGSEWNGVKGDDVEVGFSSPKSSSSSSTEKFTDVRFGGALAFITEAHRAAAKTSTARWNKPERSHACINVTYEWLGKSHRIPPAWHSNFATCASRFAFASATSATDTGSFAG